MRNILREEAIRMFDDNDPRSFDQIYGNDSELFEDVEDMIHPRMRKLFEDIYDESGNPKGQRLNESDEPLPRKSPRNSNARENQAEMFKRIYEESLPVRDQDSSKDTPRPDGDGVSEGHNRGPDMGGSSPVVNQSTPGHSDNRPLFRESCGFSDRELMSFYKEG